MYNMTSILCIMHNEIFHTLKERKHLEKVTQINSKLSYYERSNDE